MADGEGEERVFLSQELGSASVEGDGSGSEAESSSSPTEGSVTSELAACKHEESDVEKGEEGNQGNVNPQGSQEEEEGNNEPGRQKDSDGARELSRSIGISSGDTKRGVEEGGIGHPETTVRGEGSCAECVASGEFPHASKELSETTNETGHADNGIRGGDTTSMNVEHGKDEGCASEGEEAKRSRVGDDPQLRRGVVDVGVGGESRSSLASGTMVVFVTDVARVVDGTLLVGDVAHGGGWWYRAV